MFYIEDNNGNISTLDNCDNLCIDHMKKIFIKLNNKCYGCNRYGNFFIDNYIFNLKHNVLNYEMKLLKGKTIRYDILNNSNENFGYYIGYELIASNEYYKYIMRINNNSVYLEAIRKINGIENSKIIEL